MALRFVNAEEQCHPVSAVIFLKTRGPVYSHSVSENDCQAALFSEFHSSGFSAVCRAICAGTVGKERNLHPLKLALLQE